MAPWSLLLKRILALAAPTTSLAVLMVVAQLAETWLAARQGTAALAGWAILLPFSLLMQQMSTGAMGGGVVSAVARALGAGRRDEAAALVQHALIIAVVAGLTFALGVSFLARPMIGAIAGPASADSATGYAVCLFGVGAIPTWLANTYASVLRGGERHALAARVLALTWVVYPILGWALAEPAGMGLAGVGASFAAVSWVASAVMAIVVHQGGAGFIPTFRVRPTWHLFARILSVGAIACAMSAVANLTTILVTAQLRTYGTEAVAAYGIAARLEFLVIPLSFGVGSALTALVGGAVGGGDWHTARRTAWLGGMLAFAVTGVIGIIVAFASLPFAMLFTRDAAVADIAARALTFTGPAFGGFGLGMAVYFASMGAGRMAWPVAGALSRLVLAVGGGWWLATIADMGMNGYFLGVALGITAYGLVTASGVRRGTWSERTRLARTQLQ
jgi:Na+-driven multidrug efflux pump